MQFSYVAFGGFVTWVEKKKDGSMQWKRRKLSKTEQPEQKVKDEPHDEADAADETVHGVDEVHDEEELDIALDFKCFTILKQPCL